MIRLHIKVIDKLLTFGSYEYVLHKQSKGILFIMKLQEDTNKQN